MGNEMTRQGFLQLTAAFAAASVAPAFAGTQPPMIGRLVLSDAEWKKRLTAAQFDVLRRAGTETPFTSPLLDEHRVGVFTCVACKLALFDSSTKFDSHTGWPSFFRARPKAVNQLTDSSLPGESRTEVRCARCDGHLGHVFGDGPQPTGLRYCMNGVALSFTATKKTV